MRRAKQIAGMIISFMWILGIFPSMSVYANGENLFIGNNKSIYSESDMQKRCQSSCFEARAGLTNKMKSSSLQSAEGISDGELHPAADRNQRTMNIVATAANPNEQNNPANNGDTNEGTEAKSEDNSLSTLTISQGTLSPSFVYNVTDYTASVGEDVTSVSVDAKTSNEKATIESISGNTDLKQGQNTISIVVKAENGAVATYRIVVTRGGSGTSESETQQPEQTSQTQPESQTQQPEQESQTQPEGQTSDTQQSGESSDGITLDGNSFNLAASIPDDVIPQDFKKTTITCKGKEVEGLQFEKASLILIYLTTPSLEVKNTLAVYDEASNKIYPFRKVVLGEKYIILLDPPAETGLSKDYTQTTASIEKFANVPIFTNEENKEEFSLVYGVSSLGNMGWYQYDLKEETLQRLNSVLPKEEAKNAEGQENSAEMQALQNAYKDLEEQFYKRKDVSRKTITVMIFIIAVLTVVIANLLLRGKHEISEEGWDEDFKEKKFSNIGKHFKKEINNIEIKKESKAKEKEVFHQEDLKEDMSGESKGKGNKPSKNKKDWDVDISEEPETVISKSSKNKEEWKIDIQEESKKISQINEDWDVNVPEESKVRKRSQMSEDWNVNVPEESKAKVRKRSQMSEDWDVNVPEESKAKVRKRSQMSEDWDVNVPEESKAKVRKRSQMDEDWNVNVPEESKAKVRKRSQMSEDKLKIDESDEIREGSKEKERVSQATRPMVKLEQQSPSKQEISRKSDQQSRQKQESLKKSETTSKPEAYSPRKQETQKKLESPSPRKQNITRRPESAQEPQFQKRQTIPKKSETTPKTESQLPRKQAVPKRKEPYKNVEIQPQGKQEIPRKSESVKQPEVSHQKRIELDDNFEVIDLEDL